MNFFFNFKDFKSDVWSLGILYYKMITNIFPFRNDDRDLNDVFNQILKKKVGYPINMPMEDKELIKKMLNKNPRQRIKLQFVISTIKKIISSED
jgi:serine/threonine protein kinase